MWWHTPLFTALRRQRQEDLCEFKGNLVYKANFRTDRAGTQKNPALEFPPTTHTHTNPKGHVDENNKSL